MTKNKKLSVVISAFNEEKKIGECLSSVSFADEVILVDNSSTDSTVEIAKKHHASVFSRPNNLMLNVNKNFGFSKATGGWILSLDADERITPELKEEILSAINLENDITGYYIPRKNIILGKWIQHAGWYPDFQLRLFQNDRGKFAEQHVHEMLEVEGRTQELKECMLHYNYDSVNHFLSKLCFIYAPNEADVLLKKGYVLDFFDIFRFPAKEFISRFFAREGYKDGVHGLVLSLMMSFYHLIVFVYIWEKKGFVEEKSFNVLEKTEVELKRIHREISYWIVNEKIKSAGVPLRKLQLRLKRKLLNL